MPTDAERQALARLIDREGGQACDVERLTAALLAAGYHTGPRIPEPGTPEWEAVVERMARAMQVENRPRHESLNDEQRAARESETRPAYRALALAALHALREAGNDR